MASFSSMKKLEENITVEINEMLVVRGEPQKEIKKGKMYVKTY